MATIKTINPSGGDYASVNLALAANNSFTEDLDFLVSASYHETTRYTGLISLNGYTLRIYPDIPHGGDIGVGRKLDVRLNTNEYLFFSLDMGVGGRFEFTGLEVSSSLYNLTGNELIYIRSLSGNGVIKFDSNICDCSTSVGGNGAEEIFINASQNKELIVTNNKVYNSYNSGLKIDINSGTNTSLRCEYNTVDNCNFATTPGNGGIYINSVPNVDISLKNNVSTRNGYADFRYTTATPEFEADNNSDSDGTFVNYIPIGVGYNNNSTTIIPAIEFLSLDHTNVDYLKIGTSSTGLKNTGVASSYTLLDIAGVVRGLNGSYSRGCYELNEILRAMNVLDSNLYIIGKHLDTLEDSADSLLTEIFPDTTTLLMSNFEKTFNLSSEGTTQERVNRIVSAHRQRGGLSKAYFEGIGNTLGTGKYTVSIAEGTGGNPFVVAPRSIYTTPQGPATPIPGAVTNSDGTDTPYHITVTVTGSADEPDLEKLYERLKPPWTVWSYTYIP